MGVTRVLKSFSQNDLVNSTSVEDFHVLFARVIFFYTRYKRFTITNYQTHYQRAKNNTIRMIAREVR